ncbi:MAG: multidrug efflux SMR transporter [Thiotrichales bacterium]|nr:multidrug efflux SMR transporter [Thiotrichales bacterium]
MIYWIYLSIAIILEVAGTLSLKLSSQTNSLMATLLVVVFYVSSFTFLWLAIKKLDISLAYAIWAGAGTALIAVLGWLLFKDSMTVMKVLFISLIIIGVVGLKITSTNS